jgi:hypothetical protein
MKTLVGAVTVFIFLLAGSAFSMLWAQTDCTEDLRTDVQSIGARTRAEITRVSDRGANVDRALRFQADGDQALRRGELALAAQDYGRAQETASVLDRERVQALDARSRANLDLERAQRTGDDIAWAAAKMSNGNRALSDGDYVEAQLDFAEARADLVGE